MLVGFVVFIVNLFIHPSYIILGQTTLYPKTNSTNDNGTAAKMILQEILLGDDGGDGHVHSRHGTNSTNPLTHPKDHGNGSHGSGYGHGYNSGHRMVSSSDSDALFDLPVLSPSVNNDVLNVHQSLEMNLPM